MSDKGQGLTDSLEDYLEAILTLETANKVARVKDIAEKMGVQRGTVTGALKNLADKGFINYRPYSFITLTRNGNIVAREVARRHRIILGFLKNVLLLEDDEAEDNACRMEHAMDTSAIDRLVQFIEYIHHCPRAGDDWLQAFVKYYSKDEHDRENCPDCLKACVDRLGVAGWGP
jgi:DtxR family transcriptional regulator, Mn-dependent transcriptional regulator